MARPTEQPTPKPATERVSSCPFQVTPRESFDLPDVGHVKIRALAPAEYVSISKATGRDPRARLTRVIKAGTLNMTDLPATVSSHSLTKAGNEIGARILHLTERHFDSLRGSKVIAAFSELIRAADDQEIELACIDRAEAR